MTGHFAGMGGGNEDRSGMSLLGSGIHHRHDSQGVDRMKAVRYESEHGGLFMSLSKAIPRWSERDKLKSYQTFNRDLPTTTDFGPCWFTLAGDVKFRRCALRLKRMIETRGIEVTILRQDVEQWHYVDKWQLIECQGDDCKVCKYRLDWVLVSK